MAVLFLPEWPWLDRRLVANLSAVSASALAAGCGIWRAVRSTGRRRRGGDESAAHPPRGMAGCDRV